MYSGRFGWSKYDGCLTVGVNADGLYLAVLVFCRPGHPPLFIPWEDIDVTPVQGWFVDHLDIRFRRVPRVRLRVKKSLGQKIAAAANRAWHAGELAPSDPEHPRAE